MKFTQVKILSETPEIIHFQTTRDGGVSLPPYDSLNLSYWTGDDPAAVWRNRQLLSQAVGIPLENFVIARQMHGANVRIVREEDRGSGVWFENKEAIFDADALVTDLPDTLLCISTADCIPVLLYDPVKKVIAAVHAGWKGTAQHIALQNVERMVRHYGCKREDIKAGIMAGAGVCCYEVDGAVAKALRRYAAPDGRDGSVLEQANGKYKANLKKINFIQLVNAGLLPEHIEIHPGCSICSPDTYFSYRNSNGINFGQSLACIGKY